MAKGNPQEAIRQDLEQFWDSKLQQARERYFKAAAEFHRQLFEYRGRPENSCNIAGSRRAEAEAFANYCRVLATFTELVTTGTLRGRERPNLLRMPRRK